MKQVSQSLRFQLPVIALVFLLLFNLPALARTYEFEDNFEYEVERDFRLTIENMVGTISFVPSHSGKLAVSVIKEIDGVSREDAEEIRDEIDVVIKDSPSDVSIKVHYPERRSGRSFWKQVFGIGGSNTAEVHLEIEVPTTTDLLVTSASADIRARGIEGEFRFNLTSGDMKLAQLVGSCEIEMTSGDIEARDIKGDVSVNSTSSDAYFDNIEGSLDLSATSGDTEIQWVAGEVRVDKTSGDTRIEKTSGDLEVYSTSGDIWVVQRSGNFWVESVSGEIHIESEMTDGDDFEVSTSSGDITLRFPKETGAEIRASTSSGDIDAEAGIEIISLGRNEMEGRIGGGGKRLRLNSSSGDISLLTY